MNAIGSIASAIMAIVGLILAVMFWYFVGQTMVAVQQIRDQVSHLVRLQEAALSKGATPHRSPNMPGTMKCPKCHELMSAVLPGEKNVSCPNCGTKVV
jgi:hypothetical protein